MSQTNEELAARLAQQLADGERPVALEVAAEDDAAGDNPLETDFFRALNAFRAARSTGDADAVAAAEEHLREVVRSELTGEV